MAKKVEIGMSATPGAQHWNWRRALPSVSALVSLTAIATQVAAVDINVEGPTTSRSTGKAYLDVEGAKWLYVKPFAKSADNATGSINVYELRWVEGSACWCRTYLGQLTNCTACATQVGSAVHGETLGATDVMRWCDAVTLDDATPAGEMKAGGNSQAELPVVVRIPLNGARLIELEIVQNFNALWTCS